MRGENAWRVVSIARPILHWLWFWRRFPRQLQRHIGLVLQHHVRHWQHVRIYSWHHCALCSRRSHQKRN